MELWIRSQDREHLMKTTDVDISVDDKTIILINNYEMAKYKTKERALEVLDEIQELLQDETVKTETKYINNIEYEKTVTVTPNIPKNTIVYEMPKE